MTPLVAIGVPNLSAGIAFVVNKKLSALDSELNNFMLCVAVTRQGLGIERPRGSPYMSFFFGPFQPLIYLIDP